jgi:hypothetical protein
MALAVLVILARIAGHSRQAFHDRREVHGGKRASDAVVTGVALPWHVVIAVVGGIPQLLVAACVAVLAIVGGYWLFDARFILLAADGTGTTNAPIVFSLMAATATLLTVLVAWFGPAATTGRVGARVVLNMVAPTWIGTVVIAVACIILAIVLAQPLLETAPVIQWWPLNGPPSF